MSDDESSGCPKCDSERIQAHPNHTKCLDCGEIFQSGLQSLAQRFDI